MTPNFLLTILLLSVLLRYFLLQLWFLVDLTSLSYLFHAAPYFFTACVSLALHSVLASLQWLSAPHPDYSHVEVISVSSPFTVPRVFVPLNLLTHLLVFLQFQVFALVWPPPPSDFFVKRGTKADLPAVSSTGSRLHFLVCLAHYCNNFSHTLPQLYFV